MSHPELNTPAPAFELPATGGQTLSLASFKGRKVVLYFYPKDSTPGCTTEAQDFRDHHRQFTEAGAVVLGVSRDSVKSHENFKLKQSLPFDLLSDGDEVLCSAYAVIKLKKLYGKEYLGIERSTFLIDADGKLRNEWRKVSVKGHAEAVLAAVRAL